MKLVILAGGKGTRISELTSTKPKPLIKIGEMPIILHIMKIYSQYKINDFIICCGYKGELIKEFFVSYFSGNPDVSIKTDLKNNEMCNIKKKNCNNHKPSIS